MNFLAHLLLSDPDDDSLVGGLAADFLRGTPLEDLDPKLLPGIRKHQRLDEFTDGHEAHKSSRARFKELRLTAGIAVDIVYDHFLAAHWTRFSAETRDDFIRRSYDVLARNIHRCPRRLRKMLPLLIEEDWLGSYATPPGIEAVFARLNRRLSGRMPDRTASAAFRSHYDALESDFLRFFPEAQAFARSLRRSAE